MRKNLFRFTDHRLRSALLIAGVAVIILASVSGFYLRKAALIVSGFKAKNLCSDVFVSRREAASVLAEDLLAAGSLYPLKFCDAQIDYKEKTVTASVFGLAERKAVFRDGLGCTLVIGDRLQPPYSQGIGPPSADVSTNKSGAWPDGEISDTRPLPPEIDEEKLRSAVDWAFRENDPTGPPLRTRALVVVYDGRIAAERYASGFSADTPFQGWSMAKSVFTALTGILVGEGKISLESKDLLPLWRKEEDPRRSITLDSLLRMSSGLAFQEVYSSPLSDVVVMLFGTRDMVSFAAGKSLLDKPGTRWGYSSGSTMIVSGIMRELFKGAEKDYLEFPRRALFNPIGMKSAIVEPDAAGNLAGSSFMFATAKDWARFGLLCQRDGVWGPNRVFPEGWVKYCVTPAPSSVDKEYGAGFWLNIPEEFRKAKKAGAGIPGDAFHAVGYDGQFVSIIPSRKLVVVRLGLTRAFAAWDQEELIRRILESLKSKVESP